MWEGLNRVTGFVQQNKLLFDTLHAAGSVVTLFGWLFAFAFLLLMMIKGRRIIKFAAFGMSIEFENVVQSAATATRKREVQQGGSGHKVSLKKIRAVIAKAFLPQKQDRIVGKTILWVDDVQASILDEMEMLKGIGLKIIWSPDTADALSKLNSSHIDIIISDMGRGANPRAGYELLELVKQRTPDLPFLIYSGSGKREHIQEAERRGAQGATNNPLALFQLVVENLTRR